MLRLERKQHYKGCAISISPYPAYIYPKGHPCRGCPYTFESAKPSCTMGGNPSDCAWNFYRSVMKKSTLTIKRTRKSAVIEAMEKLYKVAELKYGKAYADHLRLGKENGK